MMNRLLTLAGALAVLAVVGKFCAVPVIAQVREALALVKDVDEKGRAPYQESGFVQCVNGITFCDLTLPAPPANKRLVVEHVSANISAPRGVNGTFLMAGGNTLSALPGRSSSSPTLVAVNETVLMYFEAGVSPRYRVVPTTADGSASFSATVTGYLVDLTL